MRNIASHLVVLILGLAAGVGGIAVASSDSPPRASTSAADSRIVRELHDVNSTLKLINENLGGYSNISTTPPVNKAIDNLDHTMAETCRAIAEKSYECPLP